MSDLDSLMNSFFVAGCLQATHIKLPFTLSAKQPKGKYTHSRSIK